MSYYLILKKKISNILKKQLDYFWLMHSKLSYVNLKFKNLHKDEECFIFGNGGSLKYYDISKLNSHLSICCSFSLIDKRMQKLNPEYCFFTDSYLFYPLIYNTYPFIRKFQINKFASIFRKIISLSQDTIFFSNVTNFYSLGKLKNMYYFHHYGDRGGSTNDLANKFSTSNSALEIMINSARYMGIKKCYLFGCDYLYDKALHGHFYSDYKPFDGEYNKSYCDRIMKIKKDIEIVVVRPKNKSCSSFKSVTFESYFGLKSSYKPNSSYIEDKVLKTLRQAHKKFQIMMLPF